MRGMPRDVHSVMHDAEKSLQTGMSLLCMHWSLILGWKRRSADDDAHRLNHSRFLPSCPDASLWPSLCASLCVCVSLSMSLSLCLSLCPSLCLYLSLCLFLCMSLVSLSLSVLLSVSLSVCLSLCLSVPLCAFIFLSVFPRLQS